MNARKVSHLFVASGAVKWNDPKNFPWTMGWTPSYQGEGRTRYPVSGRRLSRQSNLSDNLCDPAFGIVAQQILGMDGKPTADAAAWQSRRAGWERGRLRLALRDFSTRRAIADLSV
jgi:hypothetical protein